VLYQIDPAEYQAAYNNAQANLQRVQVNEAAAKLRSHRFSTLVGKNAVSRQESDDADAIYARTIAEVAAAKATLEISGIDLRYTEVRAPISGRIGRSSVTPGALVTKNQSNALAVIRQLDPIYVDVTQSSRELLRLKRAYDDGILRAGGTMRATLRLEDGTEYARRAAATHTGSGINDERQTVYGEVKFSEVSVDESTGAITMRAVFPNPDSTLLAGMYVRTVIEEGVNEKAILIPRKCVTRNSRAVPVVQVLKSVEGQDGVFTPEERRLILDRTIGQEWLVRGLVPGDLVLVEGLLHLRGNSPVKGREINAE
jgi:membrane fusion protein (multidrug efflux system)